MPDIPGTSTYLLAHLLTTVRGSIGHARLIADLEGLLSPEDRETLKDIHRRLSTIRPLAADVPV